MLWEKSKPPSCVSVSSCSESDCFVCRGQSNEWCLCLYCNSRATKLHVCKLLQGPVSFSWTWTKPKDRTNIHFTSVLEFNYLVEISLRASIEHFLRLFRMEGTANCLYLIGTLNFGSILISKSSIISEHCSCLKKLGIKRINYPHPLFTLEVWDISSL